jgi:hypothetical protein
MAETTADVRRDIEVTRERMSDTLAQLEHKMNVMQIVRDHPWPALALAVGAGIALSGSQADVKAAAATVAATRGTSSKVGTMLDDVVANLVTGVNQAFQSRLESWVDELKGAIGASQQRGGGGRSQHPASNGPQQGFGTGAVSGSAGNTMGTAGTWSPSSTETPRAD